MGDQSPDRDAPAYRVAGGVQWRDLGAEESHRPPDRDIEIVDVRTMEIAGNFTWGIVAVETDSGHLGLGEYTGGSRTSVDGAAASLEGENPLDVTRLLERLGGGGAAAAGIEIALWDLKGKLLDVPVYELLGGKYRDRVKIYNDTHAGAPYGHASSQEPDDTDIYTPAAYARAAREVVDDGFEGLKFDLDVPTRHDANTTARWMSNASIDHKAAVIGAVRDEIGYDVDLGVDLHQQLTVETAVRLGEKLEPYDLAWYEDPVPTDKRAAHRRVRENVSMPILAGESLTTPLDFDDHVREGTLDLAHPDVNNCGGLGNLLEIAALCDRYGIPIVPHNLCSPVGTVAGVHACAAIPNVHSLEYHAREVPWWDGMASRTAGSGPILDDGYVELPEGPGLGIELDADVVEEHLVEGSDLIVG